MTKKQLPTADVNSASTSLMTEEMAESVAKLLIHGDLTPLSEAERWKYCASICDRLGIDPVTQPFQLLKLNGKLVLYATKSCTEQLSRKYHLSFAIQEARRDADLAICIGHVSTPVGGGRTVGATGVVSVMNLKGDALANAIMKAETKSFRRATLRMCGLGMLDEVEIETIQGATSITIQEPSQSKSSTASDQPSKETLKKQPAETSTQSTANPTDSDLTGVMSSPQNPEALTDANAQSVHEAEIVSVEYEGDGGAIPDEPPEIDPQILYDDIVAFADDKSTEMPGQQGATMLKEFAVAMGWDNTAFNQMMKDRHGITGKTFATRFTYELMLAVANQLIDEAEEATA